MENPRENEITAGVFARYLEERFGRKYMTVLPHSANNPKFDVELHSEGCETLFLQLKQIITFESSEDIDSRTKSKHFILSPESTIMNAEERHKKDVANLILILHLDEGYLIRLDADKVNKKKFLNSTFRGIYIVSPKKVQDEFVDEIKNAFEAPLL